MHDLDEHRVFKKCSLSVIILTFNEEVHIERAIRSVGGVATHVFVVDSYSTDRTRELAASAYATVVQHEFVNHAKQYQWALDNLPIQTDWVMRLDADEVLTSELSTEIAERLPELPNDVNGVIIRLGYIFMGRKIKHGGRCLNLMRITRRGAARIEQRWMDEHLELLRGRTVSFKNWMFDNNINDLAFFTQKHNQYSTRESVDILLKKYHLLDINDDSSVAHLSFQAAVKRWIKEKIYNRLPIWVGPIGYFLYRYFLLLGFLDGREGLIYHFLQGFWYRFLVSAKVVEFDIVLRDQPDRNSRLANLERLTGYRLGAKTF